MNFLEKPVRHIVWDWNGTLFNDAWLCMDVMNGLLEQHALPLLTLERYQQVFDFPVIEYYRRLGFDFEKHTFEEVGTAFIHAYEKRRLECDLHEGARQALKWFSQQGLTQHVLSAYEKSTLNTLLLHFGIHDYFEDIIGNDDHYANGKEQKGVAWMVRRNDNPDAYLLIGDTVHDATVARAMGAQCVLIEGGNQHADKLASCGVPLYPSLRSFLDKVLGSEADNP